MGGAVFLEGWAGFIPVEKRGSRAFQELKAAEAWSWIIDMH